MKKLAYTIQEAESASGIRKDLLYAEINRGNLKTLKIGRRRLVRAEALEQWLIDHEARTSEAMGLKESAA